MSLHLVLVVVLAVVVLGDDDDDFADYWKGLNRGADRRIVTFGLRGGADVTVGAALTPALDTLAKALLGQLPNASGTVEVTGPEHERGGRRGDERHHQPGVPQRSLLQPAPCAHERDGGHGVVRDDEQRAHRRTDGLVQLLVHHEERHDPGAGSQCLPVFGGEHRRRCPRGDDRDGRERRQREEWRVRIRGAFAELDPIICYSIKSCGNIHICKLLANRGSGMDVVSGGELYWALANTPARPRIEGELPASVLRPTSTR